MEFDDAFRSDAAQGADFVEVRAVFTSIADGNFDFAGRRQRQIFEASQILLESAFQFFVLNLQRIEGNQDRTICGVKVADTLKGFRFDEPEQLANMLVRRNADLMSEIDKQGLVTGAAKLSAHWPRNKHGARL